MEVSTFRKDIDLGAKKSRNLWCSVKMWNKNKDRLYGNFNCVQYFKVHFISESLKCWIGGLIFNAGAVFEWTL
jgi:hypothetical protein